MDKKSIKYVIGVECDTSRQRCSGFACSNAFFEKNDAFSGYGDDTKFLTMTCGGCCGTSLAGYLEHFGKKLHVKTDIKKTEVAVHLASCIVTENRHHDRCPYVDYMKDIIRKNGFENIIEGTFESQVTHELRDKGVYKNYEEVVFNK